MNKASDVVLKVKAVLKNAGIESFSFEAIQLVCHFGKLNKTELLIGDAMLNDTQQALIDSAVQKRIAGYPLQYIIGEWEFYSLPFYVGEGVLIPRADTEVLVQTCIDFAGDRSLEILDLCSGSGCIAIALKKFLPNCNVTAVEKSDRALPYLMRNVERNDVDINVINADVLTLDLSDKLFDIIVSNPPYLSETDMGVLQTEVSYEPQMALYGAAPDGLHFYRELIRLYTPLLKADGMFAFEVGAGQALAVEQIFKQYNYEIICNRTDLCDIIRVVYATPANLQY